MLDGDVSKRSSKREEIATGLGVVIQELVSSGHSWSSIKKYTLSEIGVFIKSIHFKKCLERSEKLQMDWMGSNLSQKGLQKALEEMSKKVIKKELTKKDIQDNWKRLASFSQR
jgi:hypothetical protein